MWQTDDTFFIVCCHLNYDIVGTFLALDVDDSSHFDKKLEGVQSRGNVFKKYLWETSIKDYKKAHQMKMEAWRHSIILLFHWPQSLFKHSALIRTAIQNKSMGNLNGI